MHMMARAGSSSSDSNRMVFWYKSYACIFSFIGLLCLFTAMLSPYWVVIVGPRFMISVGLWSMCRNQTCRKYISTSRVLLLIRSLISISTLSGLVAVSWAFLSATFRNSKAPLMINAFTGITTFATMLLYYHSIRPNNAFGPSIVPTTLSIYLSWSFILGCLACFFFLLTGLLFAMTELHGIISIYGPKKHLRPTIKGPVWFI